MNRRSFLRLLGLGTAGVAAGAALLPTGKALGPCISRGGQTGHVLETHGWTDATILTRGDVFTIDRLFARNPITGREMGVLRQFVVTSDAPVDRYGGARLTIVPPILPVGCYQTVSHSPQARAAIRPWPERALLDQQTGISMRFVSRYDIVTDRFPTRMDAYACRVLA